MPDWRGVVLRLDASTFHWVLAHRIPLLNSVLSGVSRFGSPTWISMAFLLGLVRPNRWPGVVQAVLAIGLAVLLTDVVAKPLVARHRPYVTFSDDVVLGIPPHDASFPSSHAAGSLAGAYALARAFPEIAAPLWALAALVAFSRIYVGVHYPLDVIAGALVGLASAAFVAGGTRRRTDAEKLEVAASTGLPNN